MEIPLTPISFVERARRLFPDRVGVVEGRTSWTYAEYATRCDRLAGALSGPLGVRPGDRVAWLGPNTHELLEAYYGVLQAGAVLVPLNIRLAGPELERILADCQPSVLVHHPDIDPPCHEGRTVAIGDEYEAMLAEAQQPRRVEVDERSAAEIFYTSGSTGAPKGAVLTHRGLYLHAVHGALTNGLSGHDVVLHTIPLFHVNGWGTPHWLTALGGVHVLIERFDPAEVLRLVEAHRVTRLFLVPAMAATLLAHPDLDRTDTSSVVQASIGGAPAPLALLAELEDRLGCEVICGYGMTESSPTLTRSLDKPGDPPSRGRRATTGLPILGVDARVLDDHDDEVPWDGETVGEICARSNHVMDRYWNDPDETARAVRDGWLRTGDLAVVRPDGYLVIVDRRKDVIVSGGENVSSVEVENCLADHPAVGEVAVVGAPDDRWGEAPVAFVTLRESAHADPDDLRDWVRTRLARFKTPRDIHVVADLPKGGTGKVQKQELRRRLRERTGPHDAEEPAHGA